MRLRSLLTLFGLTIFAFTSISESQAAASPVLPKVLIVGDVTTFTGVQKKLEGKAIVLHHEVTDLPSQLDTWIKQDKPDVIHFSYPSTGAEAGYQTHLQQIIQRLQQEPQLAAIFADQDADKTAPLSQEATSLIHAAKIPIHDLRSLSEGKPVSQERITDAVVDSVLRNWIIKKYSKPSPPPASGPEAAAKYRETEAQRDAEVPEAYKKLAYGKFQQPANAQAWQQQRPLVLKAVTDSLGDLPPRPAQPKARLISRERRDGYTLERIALDNGENNDISALVLIPDKRQKPAPAVLWLHSSTPDKNGLITPGEDPESLGEALVREGYVVMAPDVWYYGDRAENVPSGPRDIYRRGSAPSTAAQESLLKLNLWLGRTLWGMMVRDDQIALDYLCQRSEVDAKRIGATGLSMGSTRAWWLAAVDERVAATVGVACLTRYENLIHHGNLKAHGLYYFSYGLLKHFDTEGVLALIAPRPFLALTGDLDHGSPADGILKLEEEVSKVYRVNDAADAFKSILYKDTGHTYTPEMKLEMLAWFKRWL